ncbi:hypothetical protein D9611_000652 [Ephemerocybe angulata]|uniref:F-box domain-containing protein n=1 Tax=Ephemerocybe angulata TaxID=980116 RepID=A0A8H5F7P1_9AGAR|nr:hypothetical protein D9611_000652 [Tulosesus angulatus]
MPLLMMSRALTADRVVNNFGGRGIKAQDATDPSSCSELGVKFLTRTTCERNQLPNRSPLNQLPVELLLEIFWKYVHESNIAVRVQAPSKSGTTSSFEVPSYGTPPGSPMLLSHVCPLWRAIVVSSPNLWSTIHVDDNCPGFADRLLLYVSRSGTNLLTLTMKIWRAPSLADRHGTTRHWGTCALAISQFPRCRRIYLDISWALEHALVARLPPSSTPPVHLEELSVRLPGWSSRNALKFSAYLHRSPRLKTVKWKGLYTNANGRVTRSLLEDLPTDTVRSIDLGDFHSLEDLLPALARHEHLEQLRSYVCKPSSVWTTSVQSMMALGPTSSPRDSLKLEHLHTISLHTLSTLTHVFAALELPALRTLAIDHFWDMTGANNLTSSHHHYADVGWDAVRGMLERSKCKLESLVYTRYGGDGNQLDIAVPPINEAALGRLLEAPVMESLRLLSFTGRLGDRTLRALTLQHASSQTSEGGAAARLVLPNLQILVINECWSTDGTWSEMVLSRSRAHFKGGKAVSRCLEKAHVLLKGSSQSNFSRDLMLVMPGVEVIADWGEPQNSFF